VRWDVEREVAACPYLHPTESALDTDGDKVEAGLLKLDAQARSTEL
jgi:hypothetical protein